MDEIYLLEHTHQFYEFSDVYTPIKNYNSYQNDWLSQKMNTSIETYLRFIDSAKNNHYPIKIKFGLEVCYILEQCDFDFLTGSVHWIDGWGFDHPIQKELWQEVNVYEAYRRYYDIMFELCESALFSGVAHPDSIKCFGYVPDFDLSEAYEKLASLLSKNNMYAENSGGLRLNYGSDLELGLNKHLLKMLKTHHTEILSASDAHRQSDLGANIKELQAMIDGEAE